MKRFLMTAMSAIMALSLMACTDTGKEDEMCIRDSFDGAEALEFLAVADYDAVILDIMMPVMDGYAVLKQLRAEGRMTPVLFLSARDSICLLYTSRCV